MAEPSFTCPNCGRTSHHGEDVRHRYCGACHRFVGPERGEASGIFVLGRAQGDDESDRFVVVLIEWTPRLAELALRRRELLRRASVEDAGALMLCFGDAHAVWYDSDAWPQTSRAEFAAVLAGQSEHFIVHRWAPVPRPPRVEPADFDDGQMVITARGVIFSATLGSDESRASLCFGWAEIERWARGRSN